MATAAREVRSFAVRGTAPSRPHAGDAIVVRRMLAERIAGLANTRTVESTSRTLTRSMDVFVEPPIVTLRRQDPAALLCTLDHDTIVVHGLDTRLCSRMSGRSTVAGSADGIRLPMPGNFDELDSCWEIVLNAHRRLVEAFAAAAPRRVMAWPDNLPKFSRTTLQ